MHVANNPVLSITDEQMAKVVEICEMLKRKREEKDHPFGKDIAKHLLTVLCYEIQSFYMGKMPENVQFQSTSPRHDRLCQEFLELVNKHATEQRLMGFYADALCITPKYLSMIVKKHTGRSPLEWINRTVMIYARTLLTSSDKTIHPERFGGSAHLRSSSAGCPAGDPHHAEEGLIWLFTGDFSASPSGDADFF